MEVVSCLGCLFSCAVGRDGRCRQIPLACVGSTGSAPATRGLPPLTALCPFPVYTAQLQAALQGAGPALCVLPRPKQLRFSFSGTPQRPRLGWACILCLPSLSCSGSQELDERTLPGCGAPYPLREPSLSSAQAGRVRLVSVLRSWSLAATLPVDVNHPESQ